ncbi:MAG: flagellar motor switch phosphatase FliY [Lachnospiraceae bacterium]|nr:flagellar motor switch phosphatase FliY [Lachnospiraceae bacterium]
MDGMLSQEEINALLSGIGGDEPEETPVEELFEMPVLEDTPSANTEEFLSEMEKDTVGEISNISMGTAATTLSSLVNQKVNISTPVVSYAIWDDLVNSYDRPCVFLQIHYKEGLDGNNILILKDVDVKVIADLMMGGDGTNIDGELGELHLSAICEAMNQMMGSAATSLSSMLGIKIDISPPTASLIDLNANLEEEMVQEYINKGFVRNSFEMTIGDLVDSEIMQLFPVDFAKSLCNSFSGKDDSSSSVVQSVPETKEPEVKVPEVPVVNTMEPQVSQPQATAQPIDMNQMPYGNMGYPPNMMGYGAMPYQMPPYQAGMMPQMAMPTQQSMQPTMQEVNVQPAQFQAFASDLAAVTQKENINLIMDVPLEVTVELGRTSKSIQDILEFSPGTIIELDKIAGEPIDVLVNGKYVAKGEVVVIEESFGVRVTEIIK